MWFHFSKGGWWYSLAINFRIILIHKHEPDLWRVNSRQKDIYESKFAKWTEGTLEHLRNGFMNLVSIMMMLTARPLNMISFGIFVSIVLWAPSINIFLDPEEFFFLQKLWQSILLKSILICFSQKSFSEMG